MMFHDRWDAGIRLAGELVNLNLQNPVVLGIPRGGVVISVAIAEMLRVDIDVVLSRKLRAPGQQELAIGSVSEDGQMLVNELASTIPEVTDEYLAKECKHQFAEIERRSTFFRSVLPKQPVEDRTVILTDDGIATGSTLFAAADLLRTKPVHELIIAIPVAPADLVISVNSHCNKSVLLETPTNLYAVGQFYIEFGEVSDEDALRLLRLHAERTHS